ncbi:MAG: hypothetical protein KJZ84_15225 [Bryobacteraceae bacterium]|nr:hypothetical protein [Bryobacteraceae bacterium]
MPTRPPLRILPPGTNEEGRQPVRLTCLRCDRKQCLSLPCRGELAQCLRLRLGFQVKVAILEMLGFCHACQRELARPASGFVH